MADVKAGSREDGDMFEKRLNDIILSGFTSLGLAMGQELGIFKILATFEQPATPKEIADQVGCKERYVAEWLRLMVIADIVELHGDQYYLPQHRRGPLTSEDNLMPAVPYVALLPHAHNELLECFKKDGPPGYSYSTPSRMFAYWEATRPDYLTQVVPAVIEQMPGLKEKLESGIEVCEIGCGSGYCAVTMATMYPKSRITGIDLDEDAIIKGQSMAKKKGLQNIEFIARDCTTLPNEFTGRYDFILFNEVVHDFANPVDVLKGGLRILKPGCYLGVTDQNIDSDINKQTLDKEFNLMNYVFSLYYCLTCSLQFEGSVGCGMCVGKQKLAEFIEEAGFKEVNILDIPGKPKATMLIARKE